MWIGKRAAALLYYGDWGTSKAYVLGLAFCRGGLLVVANHLCGLRASRDWWESITLVVLPAFFRMAGGVYSAARSARTTARRSRRALLLVADLTVTAALRRLVGARLLSAFRS